MIINVGVAEWHISVNYFVWSWEFDFPYHILFFNMIWDISSLLLQPLFWKDPQSAIMNAYCSTNKSILENSKQLGPGGSTAVTAIVIDGKDLWIANIGDSRAVLCERGAANQLTVDHEPHVERSRIEKQGGFVTTFPGKIFFYICFELYSTVSTNSSTIGWSGNFLLWSGDVPRVNGQLAVARAFGDQSLQAHLSSEPDVRRVPIDFTMEFVILASDGLWKVSGLNPSTAPALS